MSISYNLKCDICGIEVKELIEGVDEARLLGWSYITLVNKHKDICPSCIINNPKEDNQSTKDLINRTLKEVDENDSPSPR